jgi:hypothetical protein
MPKEPKVSEPVYRNGAAVIKLDGFFDYEFLHGANGDTQLLRDIESYVRDASGKSSHIAFDVATADLRAGSRVAALFSYPLKYFNRPGNRRAIIGAGPVFGTIISRMFGKSYEFFDSIDNFYKTL